MSRHEVRVVYYIYTQLTVDMLASFHFHPPQTFEMFSMPAQRPRVPSTRTPIKLVPSVPLPRPSNTIRPVALYIYFLCAVLVPLMAYGLYSAFGNVLLPAGFCAGPSSI
jgi:hypothetical protein